MEASLPGAFFLVGNFPLRERIESYRQSMIAFRVSMMVYRVVGLVLALISLIYLCIVFMADSSVNANSVERAASRVIDVISPFPLFVLFIPLACVLFLAGIVFWFVAGSARFLSKRQAASLSQ